jgi:hypothetical protein
MRAKLISVMLVACGVLGAVAVAAPGTTSELAMRGKHEGREGGHDNGQQHNTYNHACTTNDHAVVGNVCVIVDDLPILGNLLTG